MNTKTLIRMTATALAGTLIAGATDARTIILASDRAGTLFNATSSGIAKVATAHSIHRVIVRAFGGPDSYISALNRGDYDLTATSSTTAWFNYQGRTKSKKSTKNLRILRSAPARCVSASWSMRTRRSRPTRISGANVSPVILADTPPSTP